MNYDASSKIDTPKAKPGVYGFVVDAANEKTFQSGNPGCNLELSVAAHHDRDIRVFDTLVYIPTALWKTEHFLHALGFDFLSPPATEDLIGKRGTARFVIDKKTGYLRVDDYIPVADPVTDGAPF